MKLELLRDKTIDDVETLLESQGLKRFCWVVIIVAAFYFFQAVIVLSHEYVSQLLPRVAQ